MTPEFRVWDKISKVYDVPTQIDIDDSGHISSVDTYHGIFVDGDFLFEQYTGLKDVEGNKIFEGDIIKSSAGHTQPFYYLVEYLEEYAAFVVDRLFLGGVSGVDLKPYEVAGNIHEDPELLEEM